MDLGIDYALTQAYNMNHYFLVDAEGEIRVINKLSGTDINYSRPVVVNSRDYETEEDFDKAVHDKVIEYVDMVGKGEEDKEQKRYDTCMRIYKYFEK